MAEYTSLLTLLLARAETLRETECNGALISNYFVVSLFDALADAKAGVYPEGDTEQFKRELLELNRYIADSEKIDFKAVARQMREAAKSERYSDGINKIHLMRIRRTLDAQVNELALKHIDTALYFKTVVVCATKAIKDCVMAHVVNIEGVPASPLAPPPAHTASQSTQSQTDTVPTERSGVNELAEIIHVTRKLQNTLLESVYGQDYAVNQLVSGYFRSELMYRTGKNVSSPRATFLFAGPPGVGKTYLAQQAAKALALPFMRFDMSEYSDKETSRIEFCGIPASYKNTKRGNVTGFVADNPKCVLLFDEIEKAHLNVIHLFLQILDAGRLRDSHTDEEVSFADAIIIFTTNAGKQLYEAADVGRLSAKPKNVILKALSDDKNPTTGAPMFPPAICSRFASGNVVMLDHLGAGDLRRLVERELQSNISKFKEKTGVSITVGDRVHSALLFAEGGNADARTVTGRTNSFFHDELYELYRLIDSEAVHASVEEIEQIKIRVSLDGAPGEISKMFVDGSKKNVLIFAEENVCEECRRRLGGVNCFCADDIESARDILAANDISLILVDVKCHEKGGLRVLNLEDIESVGREFLTCALEKYSHPVYLIEMSEGSLAREEAFSFISMGVRDIIPIRQRKNGFDKKVLAECNVEYQQRNIMNLARANKVLTYKTKQSVSKSRKVATINLFDFRLVLATDAEDTKSVVADVSKPDLRFDDVIGAQDVKDELAYFVEYLKAPAEYMRKGVRAPKGILLYGPPGTGKTMLAKALAGESNVTFLAAEGNQFLKGTIGEGAASVHAMFNTARKFAPSVLFIDEIDAIAKDRASYGATGISDVLTSFLTEMDGFKTDTSRPVFVLAATNYSVEQTSQNRLDAALLRRFDRRIYVDLPNKAEREQFMRMKMSRNSAISLSDEQVDNIATRSTGMSLADLDSVVEMALRFAIRTSDGIVSDAAFDEAFETFNSGEKRKRSAESLERTARHEAGHALVSWLCGDKPTYITIVARGEYGGYMMHSIDEDKGIFTKAELLNRIKISLAGRAAELVCYGDEGGMTTGASGDIESATHTAERMICTYGMDSAIGMSYIDRRAQESDYFDRVHSRVNEILEEQLADARRLIAEHRAVLDRLVESLLERNHLKEKEIAEIFENMLANA